MRDPVVLPSGETYEKASIIRAGLRDPQTREQLTENQLTSNRALRRQIDKFLTKSVDEYITQKIQGDSETVATWQSIQILLENLGSDTSEPALCVSSYLLKFDTTVGQVRTQASIFYPQRCFQHSHMQLPGHRRVDTAEGKSTLPG